MTAQLLKFPTLAPVEENATKVTDDKIILHGGELVLHQRESKKGTWQYRLTLPDGTYERRTTGERDLEQAKQVAENRWHEVRWRDEQGYSLKAVTFAQAAKAYEDSLEEAARLDGVEMSKKDAKKIGLINSFLVPHFADTPLCSVDAKAIAKFHVDHLARWEAAKGTNRKIKRHVKQADGSVKVFDAYMTSTMIKRPGPAGRANYELLIRAVFDHALRAGLVTKVEVPVFKSTKVEIKRRGAFSPEEEKRLLDHLEQRIPCKAKHHTASRRTLWLWTRLHLLTGLRPGVESNGLRFKDIKKVNGAKPHYVLRVRAGKTGPRSVVASLELGEVIDELRKHHPCPTPDASIWQPARVESYGEALVKMLHELLMAVDDEGRNRSAYSLRHTYATNKLNKKTNLDILARNMDTSVEMLQKHYSHITHLDHADELLK